MRIEAASTSAGQPLKALVLSPLLNLAATPPAAPTMVQHVDLRDAGGAVVAVATLSLAPGSGGLRIRISDHDGLHSCAVRLCRLGALAEAGGNPADRELRALEVIRVPTAAEVGPLVGEVPLHPRGVPPFLSPKDHSPLTTAAIEGLRADAILGVAVAPRDAAPDPASARSAGAGDDPQSVPYLERRLADELTAAADAKLPVTTARHVELATLFAREIQARQKHLSAGAR